MHDEPRRILNQLLIRYGRDLHTDPRHRSLFTRSCAGLSARFCAGQRQKQRVASDLFAAPTWLPQQALHTQLARRLEKNLALTPVAATWAVETWAAALHLTDAQ